MPFGGCVGDAADEVEKERERRMGGEEQGRGGREGEEQREGK